MEKNGTLMKIILAAIVGLAGTGFVSLTKKVLNHDVAIAVISSKLESMNTTLARIDVNTRRGQK